MSPSPAKQPDDDWLDDDPDAPRSRFDLRSRLILAGTPLADPSDPNAPPSRMQSPEDQVGYGVALAIVLIGILFATVHGKGSPVHPKTWLVIIGVVLAAISPIATYRYANRFVTAIVVVVASLMISFVRPPNTYIGLFYVMLIGSVAYAFWLTRRQSKAARLQVQARRGRAPDRPRKASTAPATRGGRGKREEPRGPEKNRRYTPPQAPRERPKRSEAAAPPAPSSSRRKQRREAAEQAASKDSKAR